MEAFSDLYDEEDALFEFEEEVEDNRFQLEENFDEGKFQTGFSTEPPRRQAAERTAAPRRPSVTERARGREEERTPAPRRTEERGSSRRVEEVRPNKDPSRVRCHQCGSLFGGPASNPTCTDFQPSDPGQVRPSQGDTGPNYFMVCHDVGHHVIGAYTRKTYLRNEKSDLKNKISFEMERFLENFRAIKQSSSQQTKKSCFLVRSTKTRQSNFQMEGFFLAVY